MSYQPFLEPTVVEERSRIRQMYDSGELTPEVATVQLLRVDIDAIKQARGHEPRLSPEAPPEACRIAGEASMVRCHRISRVWANTWRSASGPATR
jgi:hypothetical protein